MKTLASVSAQTISRYALHKMIHNSRVGAPAKAGTALLLALLIAPLLYLVAPQAACAQGITGSITGTVTDPSGAVISGATVTILEVDTNAIHTTRTSEAGTFTVTQLPPGRYNVKVEKAGFKSYDESGLILAIDQDAQLNAQLAVGSENQSIEVASTAPVIQTEDSSVGQVIDSQAIENTPLNGRLSVMGLIALSPGIQGVGAQDQLATRGLTFAVGTGSRNSYGGLGATFDGAVNKEVSLQRAEPEVPSLDAISQFKVLSTGAPAEFNEPSQMIVVSSSGTNKYHGELLEFNRSKGTSAKTYFGGPLARPYYERNEFGGNFAGPVWFPGYNGKDRSFFFVAYEGFRLNQSASVNSQQPTVPERAGYFTSAINNPATGLPFPIATTGPYAGQYQIPSGSFNSVDQQLLTLLYPMPTTSGTGTNTFQLVPYTSHSTRISLHIDQKLSDKDQLRGTFLRALYGPNPDVGASSLQGGDSADGEHNTNTIIGWTHTFAPTLLIDTYASYLHLPIYRTPQNSDVNFSSIIPGLGPVDIEGAPAITITNITNVTESGSKDLEQTQQAGTSLTKVLARHTVKTGFSYLFDNHWNESCSTGTYSFNGQFTGNAFADFLLGDPSSTSKSIVDCSIVRDRSNQYAAYVQDDWKLTSTLTINAGIRYDLQWFEPSLYGKESLFVPSLKEVVVFGNSLANANPGLLATVPVALSSSLSGIPSNPYSYLGRPGKNFAPRLGFAFQPIHDTVIRGAFGIYFNLLPPQYVRPFYNTVPFNATEAYSQPSGTTPAFNMSDPFGATGKFSANPSVPAQHSLETPYTEEYNLAIEHQITNGLDFRIGYVGQHNVRQNNASGSGTTTPNINLANPPQVGVTAQSTNLYQPFSTISLNDDPIFHTSLSSLQFGVHKQYSRGFNISAEYQWTRVLGTENIENPSGASLNDSYGNIAGITPQVLAVNYSYSLPLGHGRALLGNVGNVTNDLISGWQISGISTFQTGQPFSVSYSAPGSPVGQVSGRANRVPGVALYPSSKSLGEWFNPAAFTPPPCYNTVETGSATVNCAAVYSAGQTAGVPTYDTYGNSAYDMLRGPAFQDWDMNLKKNISWHDHYNLQLRADSFNVFNHPNFQTPNANISNSNVGTITAISSTPSYEQRTVEFAAKFNF
jgi:Carboxypeptidase regulatory-like domain/TonB dependent receptor